MDYEKKYKEALERAKEKYTKCYSPTLLDYIFPELKENKDIEIKKDIISNLKRYVNCIKDGYDASSDKDFVVKEIEKQIAWLEKQESCYSFEIKKGHWYKCVCDYMLNNSDLMFKNDRLYYCRSDWRLRGEIDERNVKNIGVNGYKSFFRPVTNQEIKEWLEKQDKQKSAWSEEDERNMQNIDSVLFYDKTLPEDTCIKLRDFLKTLKQRIGG